ncbi:MAG: hypothetical protein J0H00_07825, partial [Burkholderiales bacterium]|nr:hypothetical protein [Burkholderiales bacterium]
YDGAIAGAAPLCRYGLRPARHSGTPLTGEGQFYFGDPWPKRVRFTSALTGGRQTAGRNADAAIQPGTATHRRAAADEARTEMRRARDWLIKPTA